MRNLIYINHKHVVYAVYIYFFFIGERHIILFLMTTKSEIYSKLGYGPIMPLASYHSGKLPIDMCIFYVKWFPL